MAEGPPRPAIELDRYECGLAWSQLEAAGLLGLVPATTRVQPGLLSRTAEKLHRDRAHAVRRRLRRTAQLDRQHSAARELGGNISDTGDDRRHGRRGYDRARQRRRDRRGARVHRLAIQGGRIGVVGGHRVVAGAADD